MHSSTEAPARQLANHGGGAAFAAVAVSLARSPAAGMSLTHCPLCIGLAVMSVLRAGAHLLLLGRRYVA